MTIIVRPYRNRNRYLEHQMRPPPPPILNPIELKRQRVALGMTQEYLANVLCISRQAMSRIESGTAVMSLRTACHASLIFAWNTEEARTNAAKKPAPRGRPANLSYCYAKVEGGNITGLEVEAMAPGSRYRMMTMHGSTFSSWNTYVRGPGTRHEDQAETTNPALTDVQWLDETARRY